MQCGSALLMPGERSRSRELLEASVAWLWELEELRERQHSLVLTALALGGPRAGAGLEPEDWPFTPGLVSRSICTCSLSPHTHRSVSPCETVIIHV